MTARHVAAQRLSFQRVPADFGSPADDLALAVDVADGARGTDSTMTRYLQARTSFIDHAVLDAIHDGTTQIVTAGAGYDGRSLRYAADGVWWFELDHPDTQSDKVSRRRRLEIATPWIVFGSADFAHDDVSARLWQMGHNPRQRTLFVCEGVAGYLPLAVLRSLRS